MSAVGMDKSAILTTQPVFMTLSCTFSRSFEVVNRWYFPFRENSMFSLHVRSSTNSWY